VSRNLHNWIIHQYQIRLGKPHPKSLVKWSKNRVISDCNVLENSYQGDTNTCGIHTCVVPVLIADGLPLNVFGKTSDEQKKAGTEMRRRMMLCIIDEKCWFETEGNPDNENDGKNTDTDDDVDRGNNDNSGNYGNGKQRRRLSESSDDSLNLNDLSKKGARRTRHTRNGKERETKLIGTKRNAKETVDEKAKDNTSAYTVETITLVSDELFTSIV